MAIRSFSIKNYKSFVETAEIQVRPLTLLFGYNSAGKSALARWLPLLSETVQGGSKSPLDMTALAARGATFSGILSKFTEQPSLSFSLTADGGSLDYVIRDIPEVKQQVVEKLRISIGHDRLTEVEWAPVSDYTEYLISHQGDVPRQIDIEFTGLTPRVEANVDVEDEEFAPLTADILRECLSSVFWLQAVRSTPPRREVYRGTSTQVAPDGTGVSEMVFGSEASGDDIVRHLSSWYSKATGYNLVLERGAFKGDEIYSFCLNTERLAKPIELADTGEGIGQVFPIVGLLTLARNRLLGTDPLLIFEQPELHLHQAVEPALADLMCEVAASGTAKIIAETHSESLLLAVQLALIEGRLKSADVAVYWVRQGEDGAARASEITFDSLGRPEGGDWPPGVFTHNAEKARQIVRAQLASERNAG
jgi:hypothetical protein